MTDSRAMRITKTRVAVVGATVAVATGMVAAGSSPAQDYNVPKNKKIKIVLKGKDPKFKGPKTIQRGAKLTIINKTSPRKIGPHTFTFIAADQRPQTRKEMKACGEDLAGICGEIAKAHKVVFPDTPDGPVLVKKHLVKAGKKGWDKMFDKGVKGDSWYTETKGEKLGQKVTAPVGTKLTYMCVVHPFMQGSITVK